MLISKHPLGTSPPSEILLQRDESHVNNPIIFEELDADLILKAAAKTRGAAGLSGLDAYGWRRLCTQYKSASRQLCSALAAVGRRLCTSFVHPESVSAFVACRLIPLDKDPGVRPIGIGEVPRRIVAKAVLSLLSSDIEEASGPLQVCAGHVGGCEAAIHAMCSIFGESNTECVLLVDAENTFNSINRLAALHNISVKCPPLSTILINTYRTPVRPVIQGSWEIPSNEGTTQGDPLAMPMYAFAICPIIKSLHAYHTDIKMVWYADNATAAGSCEKLSEWWDTLSREGPNYGYFPKSSKTYLVVKRVCR